MRLHRVALHYYYSSTIIACMLYSTTHLRANEIFTDLSVTAISGSVKFFKVNFHWDFLLAACPVSPLMPCRGPFGSDSHSPETSFSLSPSHPPPLWPANGKWCGNAGNIFSTVGPGQDDSMGAWDLACALQDTLKNYGDVHINYIRINRAVTHIRLSGVC